MVCVFLYVYTKEAGLQITFRKMMGIDKYLQHLKANLVLASSITKHWSKLCQELSYHACFGVHPIMIDLDVIEVLNGYAFRISRREFFRFSEVDFEGRSARAFVPYDSTSPPEPGVFRESILNSFQQIEERMQVLNKMYQCLVAGRMPADCRKLLFVGPPESGMSSWAALLRRVTDPARIATLNSGRSQPTIDEDTQLAVIQPWLPRTLPKNITEAFLKANAALITSVQALGMYEGN